MVLVSNLVIASGCVGLAGCGVNASLLMACPETFVVSVSPLVASADHALLKPGNQAQFHGVGTAFLTTGCPALTTIDRPEFAVWSNLNAADVSIRCGRWDKWNRNVLACHAYTCNANGGILAA